MNQVNIALECFSIVLSFLVLVCVRYDRSKNDKQKRLFGYMLEVNILVLVFDCATFIIPVQAKYDIILYICNFFVYSLGYVIAVLYTQYLFNYINTQTKLAKAYKIVIFSICAVAILFVVISQFNHIYYSFNNGVYSRGKYFMLSQVYSVVIIFIDVIVIIGYRKRLGTRDFFVFLTYQIIPLLAMAIQYKIYDVTFLYISTTLSLLLIYITIQIEQTQRLKQRDIELKEANMSIMVSQIQPHFLYNSLTSIYQLCDKNPAEAKKAIIEFSQYLRGNLDSLNQKRPVPFENELNHVKNYISLEKKRFEDELEVEFNINSTDFMVPALSIQPLVENAIRYGVGKSENGGKVIISTGEDDKHYFVIIEDNGVGFDINEKKDDGRSHIGIENVKSRLFSISNAQLYIESEIGKGTKVTIAIPKGEK